MSFLSHAAINDAFSSVQQLPGHTHTQRQFKRVMQVLHSCPPLPIRLLCLSFTFYFFIFCLYISLEAHVLQSENHSNIVYITLRNIIKRQENCQARWQDSHPKSFRKLSEMLSQQTQRKNSTSSAANNEEGDRRTERENEDSYTCLGYFLDPSALSILRLLDDLWSLVSIVSATVHFNSACSLIGWLHFHRCYHHTLTVIIICLNCAVTILCCQPALLYQNVQCWWIVQMPENQAWKLFS